MVVKEENGNQQLSLLMQVMSCGIVKANFVYTLGEKRVYFHLKAIRYHMKHSLSKNSKKHHHTLAKLTEQKKIYRRVRVLSLSD